MKQFLFTHGSVFSGIGGFEFAAQAAGFTNLFYCETDRYCRKVLKRHWPQSYPYEDISQSDFSQWLGKVSVLSGGDPCQPHSIAGSRIGTADARYLWPHMLKAIRECRPHFVLNENVPGTISNGVLDRKVSDLEAIGYACWPPLIIPAGAGEAIHRRDRVWLVAHTCSSGQQKPNLAAFPGKPEQWPVQLYTSRSAAHGYESWTPDKSGILRMADGLPDRPYRNPRIKALGNSIDPRIAFPIFQLIHQTLKTQQS